MISKSRSGSASYAPAEEVAEKRFSERFTSLRACLRQSGIVQLQELSGTAEGLLASRFLIIQKLPNARLLGTIGIPRRYAPRNDNSIIFILMLDHYW